MRALIRAGAAVGVALAAATTVVLSSSAPASAHDVLVSTSPADGATVEAAPGTVVLTFDQPAIAIGTRLRITGPDGRIVSTGAARCVDDTVTQDLGGALPAGHYDVEWRVTSNDGHPISGQLAYTASGPGQGAVARAPGASGAGGTGGTTAGAGGAGGAHHHGGSGTAQWVGTGVAALIIAAAIGGTSVLRRRRSPTES